MIKKSLVVFAVILSIVLLSSTSITPSAFVTQNNYLSYEENGVANVFPTHEETICEDVSADDDFSNHEIIIVLKNATSLSFPKIEDISKTVRNNANVEIESLCPIYSRNKPCFNCADTPLKRISANKSCTFSKSSLSISS